MKSRALGQVNRNFLKFNFNPLRGIIFIILLIGIPFTLHAATVDDFIPKDSFIYIKLQDLDEVYNEIQISKDWKETIESLTAEADLEEMRQALLIAETTIGTDVFSVIDTVGYQTCLAIWKTGVKTIHGGFVVHSGGNLAELQKLTKILTGLIGMTDGTLTLDAGKYRKVKYNTLQVRDVLYTYGFVGDFLVVGVRENSFEKLIDTYRKKSPSIRKNKLYSKVSKKFGKGQLTASINVSEFIPLIEDLSPIEQAQLQTFKSIFAQLNLLEVAPIVRIHTEFNPNLPGSQISPFLKEGAELGTLNGMSGDEDLFIAIAPSVLETVWQLVNDEIENAETDDAYAFITFLEGILNLNFEEDVIAGLTGEIALSVDDFTLFSPDALESLDIQLEETFQIDAENVQTHGGLMFISNNPQKWDQIGNSLSNLQNTSVSQIDYKGTKVSKFASNIFYAERGKLSLLSFSEDQMYAMVDRLHEKKKGSFLKQLPKTALVVVKLNILKLLESIAGAMPLRDNMGKPAKISPFLAWITVKGNEAIFEATLSDKESPLEVFAKFAPFIISNLKN